MPGSEEKIRVLAARAAKRQPLHVAGDAVLLPHQGYVTSHGGDRAGACVEELAGGELSLLGLAKLPLSKTKGQRRAA